MSKKPSIPIPPGFPVELLKPMPSRHLDSSGPGGKAQEFESEFILRTISLATHYGIPADDEKFYLKLCVRVLEDFLFRQPRRGRGGRRRDNSAPSRKRRERLRLEVDRMRVEKHLRDQPACDWLSKGLGGGSKEFRGKNPETLRKWLRKGREESKGRRAILLQMLRDRRVSQLPPPTTSQLADWSDAQVTELLDFIMATQK